MIKIKEYTGRNIYNRPLEWTLVSQNLCGIENSSIERINSRLTHMDGCSIFNDTYTFPQNNIYNVQRRNTIVIENLIKDFTKEFDEKKNTFGQNEQAGIILSFIIGASFLIDFDPKQIGVEISSSSKYVYFFSNIENKNLHMEIYPNRNPRETEVVINIYENKTQVLSNMGSLLLIFDEIIDIFSDKEKNYLRFIQPRAYGLSENFITSK